MTLNEKLITVIPKLEAIEFVGLAKLLGVKTVEENPNANPEDEKTKYVPRDFIDVLDEILYNFSKLDRNAKRVILRVVKYAEHTKNS